MPRLKKSTKFGGRTVVPPPMENVAKNDRKAQEAERARLKRQQETPAEAERRREKDREQKRARRAFLKEHLPPDALQHKRAKEYETTLKKRYQNDDKPYNGPDGLAGETVGDRRRRLEAQRVRERRAQMKLMKEGQSQSSTANNVENQNPALNQSLNQPESSLQGPVQTTTSTTTETPTTVTKPDKERVRLKLHRRIVTTISKSIETKEERQLIHDAKTGKFRPSTRTEPSDGQIDGDGGIGLEEEEELHFKRFFVAQLESDFMAEKQSLVRTALELELGSGNPQFDDSERKGNDETSSEGVANITAAQDTGNDNGGGVGVVVKLEVESDGELPNLDNDNVGGEENEETVQDWLARLYTSAEGDDDGDDQGQEDDNYHNKTPLSRSSRRQSRRPSRYMSEENSSNEDEDEEFQYEYPGVVHPDEDEENFGPRPTPQQLYQQKEKIFKLKLEHNKRVRYRKLQSLQEAVEEARARWVEQANLPEDDERRAIVDADREALIERIYAEKRTLIQSAKDELAQKMSIYSQESEEERNARISSAYSGMEEEILANSGKEKKTPRRRRITGDANKTKTPRQKIPKPPKKPSESLSLDPATQKLIVTAKGRVTDRMGKAEYNLYNSLRDALIGDGGLSTATYLEKFENILTTGDNPAVIQYCYLVRMRKGRRPQEVVTFRKMLYTYLSRRMTPLLSRGDNRNDRSGTFARVPLYQRLFPDKSVLPQDLELEAVIQRGEAPPTLPPPERTPVSADQSQRDATELREYLEKTEQVLGANLKVNKGSNGFRSYTLIKSDKERHERCLALRRKTHAKKKYGVDIELGAYLRKKGTRNRKFDKDGNEITKGTTSTASKNNIDSAGIIKRKRGPNKKKTSQDYEYPDHLNHPQQNATQYSGGGAGSSCDYSGGQNQDDDEYGWLPMGSGMQLSGLLTTQQQQQQASSSNAQYSLRLVGDPTASANYSNRHHQQQQQFYTNEQQSGWNLSHQNQPHSSQQQQWSTIAFPNPIWNSSSTIPTQGHAMAMYHTQSHHLGRGRRPPSDDDDDDGSDYAPSPNASDDSDADIVEAPHHHGHYYQHDQQREIASSTTSRTRRGRPRKGQEKKKGSGGSSRKNADGTGRRRRGHPLATPSLLAVEAELPSLNQNPAEVLPLMLDNAESVMRDIVPICPYCQEVLVGPYELDRHVKKSHPGKPLPSRMATSTIASNNKEVAEAVASIEGEEEENIPQQKNDVPPVQESEAAKTLLSINNQEDEVQFSCKSCPTQYKNPFALIEHTFTVHYPGKLYQCPISRRWDGATKTDATRCSHNNVRYERTSLRLHLPKIHPQEAKGTWTMGINSIKGMSKASTFFCLHCNESYTSYPDLLEHYAATHGKVRYLCETCGIYLREDDYLVDHVRIFHPETNITSPPPPVEINPAKIFLCKVCFSEFSSKSFLSAHTAHGHSFIDEGDGNERDWFTCRGRGCAKQFGSKKRKEEHEKTCKAIKKIKNAGKKSGENKEDDEEFSEDQVDQDTIQSYNSSPYKCEICRASYLSLGTLRLHSIHIHKLVKFFHENVVKKGLTITETPQDSENNEATTTMNVSVQPFTATLSSKPRPPTQDEILNNCDPSIFDRIYSCKICPYTAPANVFHAIHLGYDAYLKRYCAPCSKVYSQPFLLINHNESVHGMDSEASRRARGGPVGQDSGTYPTTPDSHWLSCQVCNRGFTPQEYHTFHALFQQGLGARRCATCDKIYLSYYTLRKHMTIDHQIPMNSGSKGKRSQNPNHVYSRGKIRGPSAGGPGASKGRELQDQDYAKLIIATVVKKLEGSMTIYTCKVCLSGYKSEAFARTHIASAHREDAFTRVFCTKCNQTFACRDNLLKHDKVVHVDKALRYKCPFNCPEIFVRIHKLKQHCKASHPGKVFVWKDAEIEKIRVEEEDADGGFLYECKFCQVMLKTKDSMKMHVTTKHFSIHFTNFCELCGLQLHGSLMKRHMQVNHSEAVEGFVSKRKSGPRGNMAEQARLSIHQVLENVKAVYDKMEEVGMGDFRPGQILRQRGALTIRANKTGIRRPLREPSNGRRRKDTRKRPSKRKKAADKDEDGEGEQKSRRTSRRTTTRARKRVNYDSDTDEEEDEESEEMELGSDNESESEEDYKPSNMKKKRTKQPQKRSTRMTSSKAKASKPGKGRKKQSSSDENNDEDANAEFDFFIKPEPMDMDSDMDMDCIFPDAILEPEDEEIPQPPQKFKTEQEELKRQKKPGPASKTLNNKKSAITENMRKYFGSNKISHEDESDKSSASGSDSLQDKDSDEDENDSGSDYEELSFTRRRCSRNNKASSSQKKRRQTKSSPKTRPKRSRQTRKISLDDDDDEDESGKVTLADSGGVRVMLERCD